MGNELSQFEDLCSDLQEGVPIDHIKYNYLPSIFNDQHAVDLAQAFSHNSKVEWLDFNTGYLTKKGTKALTHAIRHGPSRVKHLQLRYDRDDAPGNTRVTNLQARRAVQAIWDDLRHAPALREMHLMGTDLALACREFGRFLKHTSTLRALRARNIPELEIGAGEEAETGQQQNRLDQLRDGFAANATLEEVVLLGIPNATFDAILSGLEDHPKLKWLEVNSVGDTLVDTAGLRSYLEGASRGGALEKFVFSNSTAPLEPIFQSLRHNLNIKTLQIEDCVLNVQEAVQVKLLLQTNTALQRLLLSKTHLGHAELREIALGLYRNRHLLELDISSNHLHDAASALTLRTLLQRNRSLQSLDLSRNHWGGSVGIRSLAQGLARNAHVQELVLSTMFLLDDDVAHLTAAIPPHSPLKALLLSNNMLGPTAVQHLIRFAERHAAGLERLALNSNQRLRDDGCRRVADHLRSPTCRLKLLILDGTNIGEDGWGALSAALEANATLEYLSMDELYVTETALASLSQSLPGIKKLNRLDFYWNRSLPDEPPDDFLNAIERNTSLCQIDITGLEKGPWTERIQYCGLRNRCAPLLRGSSNPDDPTGEPREVPAALWPVVFAALSRLNVPSVAMHCLRAKLPWLLKLGGASRAGARRLLGTATEVVARPPPSRRRRAGAAPAAGNRPPPVARPAPASRKRGRSAATANVSFDVGTAATGGAPPPSRRSTRCKVAPPP